MYNKELRHSSSTFILPNDMQKQQSTRGDSNSPSMASERRLNHSMPLYSQLHQEQQPQKIMKRSLSPHNYANASMRHMAVQIPPPDRMRSNHQRTSMFASGERGSRYKLDPAQPMMGDIGSVDEQHILPQHRSNQSIRTSDVSALTVDTKNEGSFRQQSMQQQRSHQSMRPSNVGSFYGGVDVTDSLNMTRQQSMRLQRSHQSIKPVNFNAEASSRQYVSSEQFGRQKRMNQSMMINRSDGIGFNTESNFVRQQFQQQPKLRQSMQIPRNKNLRQSFPGSASDQQQFEPVRNFRSSEEITEEKGAPKSQRNSLARSMMINRDSNSMANFQDRQSFLDDVRDIALPRPNNVAKSMVINRNSQSMANFQNRQSFLDHTRDAAISSRAVSRRPQRNNVAKSMVINRNSPSMANLQERRSLQDSLQNMSTEHYQPAGMSFCNDEQKANQLQHSDRLGNSETSGERNQPHSNTQQRSMISQPKPWIDSIIGEDILTKQLQKSSFTSQGDKSTESMRNSLSEKEHGVALKNSFDTIQSENDRKGFRFLKRNDSEWRTLTEDKSHSKYQCAIVGVVCGLILIAGIVATVIVFAPFGTNDNMQDQDNLELPKDTITPPLPIRDIEGRCSPSNIHGSMDLCIEACEKAACCYPSFSGESCYDEANSCIKYRPYCDVIFAPWINALEGAVAPPPDELFDQAEWDEVCLRNAIELPHKKRLLMNFGSSRLRDTEITSDVCEFGCLQGGCCFARSASHFVCTSVIICKSTI